MKKLLLGVVLTVGVGVLGVLGVAATKPDTMHVERTAQVSAPATVVFEQVADFHKWAAWSPWAKLDPNQSTKIDGAASGVGANYHWAGNDKVGEGNMAIVEAKAGQRIGIKLDFLKPFAASNTTVFSFTQSGNTTQVTWSMEGNQNLMMKAFSLFMDMDKSIGKDFDKGLADLKAVSEAEAERLKVQADFAAAEGAAAPAP